MPSREAYISIPLRFRYHHGFAALAPFFQALEEQRAVGTQCPQCGRCWYPPRVTCPNHRAQTGWCELAPHGTVTQITHGPGSIPLAGGAEELIWGLVQLDGCNNAILARLVDASSRVQRGTRVTLVGTGRRSSHPIQQAVFAPDPA